MNRIHTLAAGLAIGLSLTATTFAGDTWEYDEERASEITRQGEMDKRSKDGWRIVEVASTDRGHLMILGKSKTAETGRDAERHFEFKRSSLQTLAADMTAMGKDGYTVDTVVADNDGYQVIYSRARDAQRTPLRGSTWAFKSVDLGDGTDAAELRRAGDDGWIAFEMIRDGDTTYALMYRDAGAGATHRRFDYEYRRILPTSEQDLARATERHDIVAMVPDGAQLGLLLKRDRATIDNPATWEYQIIDAGRRADQIERTLSTAGSNGWKLMDIDEDTRAVRLLMRRPKAN
jgi:hypothetical protein